MRAALDEIGLLLVFFDGCGKRCMCPCERVSSRCVARFAPLYVLKRGKRLEQERRSNELVGLIARVVGVDEELPLGEVMARCDLASWPKSRAKKSCPAAAPCARCWWLVLARHGEQATS